MDKKELKELLFPFSEIRSSQKELIKEVDEAIGKGSNLIVHAPTGLGKTAASISPALKYVEKNKGTVFFLTSRHTQHVIAIETLQEIKKIHGLNIAVADIVGKKGMCAVPGVEKLYSNEFSEYCKSVREDDKCEFNLRSKKKAKLTPRAERMVKKIKDISPIHSEKLIEMCIQERLCPYEIAIAVAKDAKVVVADYFYIFNPRIRDTFFKKTSKDLPSSIIIVDEGHNLPFRLRDLMTQRLSTVMLDRAIKEAKKHGYEEAEDNLKRINKILLGLAQELEWGERLVSKEDFMQEIEEFSDYTQLIADLALVAEDIREISKQSYIGSISRFLEGWEGTDDGFVRIITQKYMKGDTKKRITTLSYRCLDPSLVSKQVIVDARSTILMSGTLTPLAMYNDVLGFDEAKLSEHKSPFPEENRLAMIIPDTTTKYTARNPEQYKKIGEICAEIANTVPGNIIFYFPSYMIRDEVDKTFSKLCRKTTFLEMPNLTKQEKIEFLEKFKGYNKTGAAMLAVVSGSFGEGIDLPGDQLVAAVVVGLPLQVPDLEIKALIKYYDEKFSKGWDYGYVFPAMNKVMQNAGRVIRSETDQGAIMFLDERYSWEHYARCFPRTWNLVTTKLYKERIEEFFG